MQKKIVFNALKKAFPYTIPILTGFLFLGFTYGLYAKTQGLSFWYPVVMAIFIFGGSLEFIAVTMLFVPFNPFQALLITIMVQARHLFYGISMLEKYRNLSFKKKLYSIYALCDETFSINYTVSVPKDIDKGWFYFWVSFLDQFYWVLGTVLGGLFGSFVHFNTKGLDFVLTAMFTVIFVDRLIKEKKHYTALIGFFCTFLCLLIFGKDSFMIPSMVLILALLTVFRKPLEKYGELE